MRAAAVAWVMPFRLALLAVSLGLLGPADAQTFPSSGPPLAIPDDAPAGVASAITVAGGPDEISDLDVRLDIEHTWVGDLRVELASPAGTRVVLVDQPRAPELGLVGCGGNDIAAVADDEGADGTFEADCMNVRDPGPAYLDGGAYAPNEALAAVDGEGADGVWTLTVADLAARDAGALVGWALVFGGSPPVTTRAALAGTSALTRRGANPFSARTRFELRVADTQAVRVGVYDAMGREVAVLLDAPVVAGVASAVVFERGALPAGAYVVRARGETFEATERVTILF